MKQFKDLINEAITVSDPKILVTSVRVSKKTVTFTNGYKKTIIPVDEINTVTSGNNEYDNDVPYVTINYNENGGVSNGSTLYFSTDKKAASFMKKLNTLGLYNVDSN